MNVVFAPRALRDLESIARYLSERSAAGAANVMAAIKASLDALAAFPQLGRAVDEEQHRRLRRCHAIPTASTIEFLMTTS